MNSLEKALIERLQELKPMPPKAKTSYSKYHKKYYKKKAKNLKQINIKLMPEDKNILDYLTQMLKISQSEVVGMLLRNYE